VVRYISCFPCLQDRQCVHGYKYQRIKHQAAPDDCDNVLLA
jgi:hypothetical protein